MPGFRFQQVRRFQTGLRRTRLSPSVRRAIRLSKTRRGRALARRFVSSFAEETRQVTTKPTAWENLSPTGKAMVSVGLALGVAGLGSVYMSGMTTDAAMLMDTEVPLSPAVREMLRSTFGYTATGLGATAAAAFAFYRTGWAERSAQMGFLGTIGLLIAMIVAMTITSGIDYENTLPKHLAWLTAMSIMGFFLAPFAFLGVEILTKAAFATAVLMGSISVAAASAPSESFLWMQGYLSVGCGLLLAASLATFFFPASPMLEAAVLYGGLGLFSVFQLYDVQKVIAHSQKAESRGMMIDPINESFAIYMNIINVFIRLAMIFANQSNRRR